MLRPALVIAVGGISPVEDGEALMEFLRTTEVLPEILLLDINMPRLNGVACLKLIKADARLQAMPVIIFSTSADITRLQRDLGYHRHAWRGC